jgi:hypothetical protein
VTTPGSGGETEASAALEEGKAAFFARDLSAAHLAFERGHRRDPRDPLLRSWYGVTLVLVERNSNLGVTLCDDAVRVAGADPELLLNQARVHVALNQRERAVRAVNKGLELWPEDERLKVARLALGTRSSPVIPFLPRGNPLNKLLGRLRHRWRQSRSPQYELSPVALGVPGPAGVPDAPPEEPRS